MDAAHFFLAAGLIATLVLLFRLARERQRAVAMLADIASGRRPSMPLAVRPSALIDSIGAVAAEVETLSKRSAEEADNLKAVLSSMVEGVMVADQNRVIRLVNASFPRLFDLKHDPVGQTVLRTLREAAIEDIVRTTIEERSPQSREVTALGRTSNENRHFAVNAVPVADGAGQAGGAVVVFHEITQLRQLEMVRREFVSNVSHELRTPLSIFQGYVENLIDEPDMPASERGEIVHIMRRHALRMNALLEDLLMLARLESRRIELDPVPIQLLPFLEQLAEDWEDRLGEREQRLALEIPPGFPLLRADPLRLEQVFNNLIDNSSKYSGEGCTITVSAAEEGAMLCLRVRDEGQGVPSSDLPHVFERFYRVDKARSREAGGTGLGLAIVKHIVALHGGTVEAQSVYGAGTTITVRLPSERLAEQV